MTNPMRRIVQCRTAVCLVLLGFAAAVSAQTPEWKPYSYPADGFQASFPSAPDVQKKDIPTDAGTFQLRSYIATDGAVAIFVGVCDYGASTNGKDPDVLLQGAKNGALQNSSSHLIGEKAIALGVYPGLEFQAVSDSAQYTARIYMVGNILYEILVVAPLDKSFADATRFLDSFQLIAKTAN